jgi:hypothetical protein
MAWQLCQRPLLPATLAAAFIGWALPSAMAGEAAYCVTCKGPDQTYVCRVAAGGSKPTDALKLYCVVRTAKEGHHASCSAERNSPSCNGVEKVYSYDGPLPEDLAADPRVKHLTDKIEEQQDAFDKPRGKGPKTLVELGGRAVSASRQGLRNARGALGGSSQADPTLPVDQPPPDASLAYGGAPAPLAAEEAADASLAASHPNRMQRAYRCMMSFFRKCGGEPSQ